MTNMKLKTKMMVASVATLVVPLVVSILVVSYIIDRQNRIASRDHLKRSVNIIRGDLLTRQAKLQSDAVQLAEINQMGSTLGMLIEYRGKQSMETLMESTSTDTLNNVLQVGRTGKLQEAAIYDLQGNLVFFAVRKDQQSSSIGYVLTTSKTSIYAATVQAGQTPSANSWKVMDRLPDSDLKLQFSGKVPDRKTSVFRVFDNQVYIVSYAPVKETTWDKATGKPRAEQVGFSAAAVKIAKPLVKQLSFLTGMKINIFSNKGFSVGDVPRYNKISAKPISEAGGNGDLAQAKILFNNVTIGDESYYQSVLPLYGSSGPSASIAVLYSTAAARAYARQMVQLLLIIYFGCIIVIIPFSILFSNALTKPINIAIASLTASAREMSSASSLFSSSAQKLSRGALDQAASIDETSSSLEEMSSVTKRNADNAGQVDELSKKAAGSLDEANQSMKALIRSMEDTSSAGGNVVRIIKSIDGIAFQTNLLALNAAVEAARAGEAGAGFAVVAEEVRSLARRSAEASKNTQELVNNIIGKIDAGSHLVKETDERYRNVALSVQKVMALSEDMSAASSEQALGIGQINKAVEEIDKMTQQNVENARESTSASQQLSTQAEQMERVVQYLQAMVGGNGSAIGKPGNSEIKRRRFLHLPEHWRHVLVKPAAASRQTG